VGQVIEYIPHDQNLDSEQTLERLAGEPNLKFLKIFPRRGPLSRAAVVQAFNDAFEQIGGISRLSLWADSHPDEFFKLYARLLPPSSHPELDDKKDVKVLHVLPPTALDAPPEEKDD
jgi:hypothetical protein